MMTVFLISFATKWTVWSAQRSDCAAILPRLVTSTNLKMLFLVPGKELAEKERAKTRLERVECSERKSARAALADVVKKEE